MSCGAHTGGDMTKPPTQVTAQSAVPCDRHLPAVVRFDSRTALSPADGRQRSVLLAFLLLLIGQVAEALGVVAGLGGSLLRLGGLVPLGLGLSLGGPLLGLRV